MGKDITDLKKKITGEISRGLSSGQMYGEISRNIASWARIPKNNAMRIARTEAHRIQCKATADAQFRAKEKGADVVKQWDASLDKRTRDSHVQVDGEIRELDERFSNGLRYPGDPSGGAGEVINCRCALLQRARWALGNDYTKWSADAPIVIDDEGTTQFAIIDSKSFKEFKGYYMDATRQMTMNFENGTSSRVRSGAQKIKGKTTVLSEYTVGGVTYKVDGKHVLAKSTEREKKVAELLSEEFGKEVMLVPRIVYPQGISTPDYIIDGEKYDLKSPTGSSIHVLYNMVNNKKRQADNFVFDISNNPLEYKVLEKDIQYIFDMPHTSFVKKIVVIKDGKIIKTYTK
jgi:SPP1 gp7 family putative phage head morphogenesis protein